MKTLRTALALALVAAALPAALSAGSLELVTPGEATLEGVLVRWEGVLQIMVDAGTHQQRPYPIRVPEAHPELMTSLEALAVDRRAVPLVGEERHVQRGGLLIPERAPPENPYEPDLFRIFAGRFTTDGHFEVETVSPRKKGPSLARVMPLALQAARDAMKSCDKEEARFAFTLLERAGMLEAILEAAAPVLREADLHAE